MKQSPIQLANITKDLNTLWDEQQGEKKTRASLFTLLLYVHSRERAPYYEKLIKSVVSKFPCRVLLISHDVHSSAFSLHASVEAVTVGEGSHQAFCEIIKIDVAGNLIQRIPSLVLSYILPDLPIYLLWTDDPTRTPSILHHLEPLIDRLIFDAESTNDLPLYCHTVRNVLESAHCAVSDLNWSALIGWRVLLADYFNSPNTLHSLQHATHISIHYNKKTSFYQKHPEIEAAYLQAWLASRLKWTFLSVTQEGESARLLYSSPHHEVTIMLTPKQEAHKLPGEILSLAIESSKSQGMYRFEKCSPQRVSIQYTETELCQIPYTVFLKAPPEGQEIIQEIFYPSTGKHYADMLHMLSHTHWQL